MLKFEDFAKLEIRVGTVLDCQRVPETDRLLKLTVDLGTEKKQIVAGFAQFLSPEELINKQVPIVCNIEPAKIKGILSEGILLALDPDPGAVLLLPEKAVKNGCKVR